MNFLKIAIGNDVEIQDSTEWSYVPFTENSDIAELAAIVLNKADESALDLAKNLQNTSGLGIPIIQVSDNVVSKKEQANIINKANEYRDLMVPGFLTDLVNFAEDRPISFTTPGHHNGQYYEKHPAGVVFNRFFGKNLMFADTSDTVDELGDTMTHGGTPLTAEQKAAKTYKADKVYFCTNGTTSSNSICASALLAQGDLVLFDRNNHK